MTSRVDQQLSEKAPDANLGSLHQFCVREVAPVVKRLREAVNSIVDTDLSALEAEIAALEVSVAAAQADADAAQSSADAAQATANSHASRHVHGGADEIDGDSLDVDYSPSNYTPTGPDLQGQLAGIDAALAAASTNVQQFNWWHRGTVVLSGTFYWTPWENLASVSTESQAQILMTRSGTLQNMYIQIRAAGSGSNRIQFDLRVNGSNTGITLIMTPGTTTVQTDLTHTFSVVAGDLVSLQYSSPDGAYSVAPGSIAASWELSG